MSRYKGKAWEAARAKALRSLEQISDEEDAEIIRSARADPDNPPLNRRGFRRDAPGERGAPRYRSPLPRPARSAKVQAGQDAAHIAPRSGRGRAFPQPRPRLDGTNERCAAQGRGAEEASVTTLLVRIIPAGSAQKGVNALAAHPTDHYGSRFSRAPYHVAAPARSAKRGTSSGST